MSAQAERLDIEKIVAKTFILMENFYNKNFALNVGWKNNMIKSLVGLLVEHKMIWEILML